MELTIKNYIELERLGLLDREKIETKAEECKNIRELEYKLYLDFG